MDAVHLPHVPISLRAPCVTMSWSDPLTGNQASIFVGIVDDTYTNEMWNRDVTRLRTLFGITDDSSVGELMVASIANKMVDSEKLKSDMFSAMELINRSQIQQLRIVGLGVGSSPAVTDALESLLRGWNTPEDCRHVQFIALGESADYHYLNFCKSLSLKKLCKSLQYYNTMDYNDYGFLRNAFFSTGIGMTEEQLQRVLNVLQGGANTTPAASNL